MTNNQHVERLESLAAELDKAMAFLDPPTPGETYWQELDAVSIRAGAAALRGVEGAKAALLEKAEADRDAARAEAARLREALTSYNTYFNLNEGEAHYDCSCDDCATVCGIICAGSIALNTGGS